MVRTQDGFELAELDLSMRGPGEFFGTRQAGLPDFRVANLVRDRAVSNLAKHEAERFANASPAKAPKPNGRASGPGSKKPGSAATAWSKPDRALNAAASRHPVLCLSMRKCLDLEVNARNLLLAFLRAPFACIGTIQ